MESNLTFRELEDTIDPLPPGQQRTRGPEVQRSPLMSYINQTTRDYRSEGGRDAVNMSIGRNIFCVARNNVSIGRTVLCIGRNVSDCGPFTASDSLIAIAHRSNVIDRLV